MTTPAPAVPLHRGRLIPAATHPRWRSIPVNAFLYAGLMLALFLVPILASQALGVWTTSGKLTGAGERISATGADPAEIKGWMTIQEVAAAYGFEVAEFRARFVTPAETPAATPLKDLEKVVPGFSVEDVRAWLRERGLPLRPEPRGAQAARGSAPADSAPLASSITRNVSAIGAARPSIAAAEQ
jgi:hypothetical protein